MFLYMTLLTPTKTIKAYTRIGTPVPYTGEVIILTEKRSQTVTERLLKIQRFKVKTLGLNVSQPYRLSRNIDMPSIGRIVGFPSPFFLFSLHIDVPCLSSV